jgi:hypothetical protein
MTVDCQWIEKNLEALCCDTLSPEENRLARAHIENCASCAKEVAALNLIDPIVKRFFQSELNRAVAPRPRRALSPSFVGVSAAALISVAILLFITLPAPQQAPVASAPAVAQQIAPAPSPQAEPVVKSTDTTTVERAKPVEPAPADRVPANRSSSAQSDGPDFQVTDPAGYSRTLADYRGHVLIIGVLNTNQPDVTANLESLYKTFGSNPKLRFLGVSNDRQARIANATFPVVYNHGSKLLGARPGEFVVVDESGATQLRGSLMKDLDNLRKTLQEK